MTMADRRPLMALLSEQTSPLAAAVLLIHQQEKRRQQAARHAVLAVGALGRADLACQSGLLRFLIQRMLVQLRGQRAGSELGVGLVGYRAGGPPGRIHIESRRRFLPQVGLLLARRWQRDRLRLR